ncbi:MAG: shikimate kinase AroL [Desulfobacula sp.]|nr:shikimate kinase AroL [Desulfobacula sp.]
MKIYLIGYRCTGKTTIGKKLAACLNTDFLDTDTLIQQESGMSILKIVETYGWEKFRKIEKKTLKDTISFESAVISTGGGIVLDAANRKIMRAHGICIWLTADVNIIVERLNKDSKTKDSRPALSDFKVTKETDALIQTRMPLYQQTHHLTIDTGETSPDHCVKKICRRLKNVRI